MPKRYKKQMKYTDDPVTHPLCQIKIEEDESVSNTPMEGVRLRIIPASNVRIRSVSPEETKNEDQQQDKCIPNAINRFETEFEELLQIGAIPNTYTEDYKSVCHVAAYANITDDITLLLREKAGKTRRDDFTLLHFAAWAGNNWTIAVLLGFPKDLQKTIASGMTPEIEEEVIELRSRMNFDMIDNSSSKNRSIIDGAVPGTSQETVVDKKQLRFFPDWYVSGWTPLHIASYKAHHNTTRLLLAAGANPNSTDQMRRTPLDMAGTACHFEGKHEVNADNYVKTIQALIKFGGELKNPFYGSALQTAVHLCSAEAIQELLAAGAPIEIINTKGNRILHECVDKLYLEPLKVLANHPLPGRQCKSVDLPDKSGRTALHAAILSSWLPGVCAALEAGANVTLTDKNENSAIHLAARKGNIDILNKVLDGVDLRTIVFRYENVVESPLLCAIRSRKLDCVKKIVEAGGSLKVSHYNDPQLYTDYRHHMFYYTKYNLSPTAKESIKHNLVIHAAAEIGNLDILKYILSKDIKLRKLLQFRCQQLHCMIPVEFASLYNRFENFKYLLQETIKDDANFDPSRLLDIVSSLSRENMYNELMSQLPDAIRIANKKGHNPLHCAIEHCSRRVILDMIHNGADLSHSDEPGNTAINLIMKHISKPTDFITDIFDRYIKTNGILIQKRGCEITVDYRVLMPPEAPSTNKGHMRVLKALLECDNRKNQRQLLEHPLVESFLYLKWKSLSTYYYITVSLYTVLVILISWYIVSVFYWKDQKTWLYAPPFWVIYLILAVTVCQEFIGFNLAPKAWKSRIYLIDFWVKCVTFVFIIVTPLVVSIEYDDENESYTKKGFVHKNQYDTTKESDDKKQSVEWQRHLATLTLVLSWLNIMMLLSKEPLLGYYIQLFWKVSMKIIKILFAFLFLIIMFSYCFMIQFHSKEPFDGPITAILKTLVMLASEFEYDDNFSENKAESISASVIALRLIFAVFLIVAAIVLMNLMTGIAVSDIQYLVKYGNLRRLEQQVRFLNKLEVSRGKNSIYHNFKLYSWLNYKKVPRVLKIKPVNDSDCCFDGHIKEQILKKAEEQLSKIEREKELNKKESKLDEILQAITSKEENIIRIESKLEEILQALTTKEQNKLDVDNSLKLDTSKAVATAK